MCLLGLWQSVGSSYLAGLLLLSTMVFCWFGMPKIYMYTASPIWVLSLEVFIVVSPIPSLYYYVDFCYCVASFLGG